MGNQYVFIAVYAIIPTRTKGRVYMSEISKSWVSAKEIAEHMSVAVETVRQWTKLERIPCYRMGKL